MTRLIPVSVLKFYVDLNGCVDTGMSLVMQPAESMHISSCDVGMLN